MSWRDGTAVIIRARREGVALFAKPDGKLGWKAAHRPPDELLAILKDYREEILALLPQPPSAPSALPDVEQAKLMIGRLRSLGFRPYLDDQGALRIADATGRGRDVSRYLPIGKVFDTIVAGLSENPWLLDETVKALPALADRPLPRESRPLEAPVSPACSTLENRQTALGGMTYYEFFCGSGMAREGLGAGWQCLFANDNDRSKAASYAANFGREGLMVGDVARLTTAILPGVALLAWSSFPCQDLSLAGDRAGLGGSRSGTFWAFWRLMQALRAEGRAPRIIVVENVPGLLTSHEGRDFDALVSALAEDGYRVGALVIDAALLVPQSRERVFVVAADAALTIPDDVVAPGPETPFHPPMLVKAHKRLSPKAQAAWLWFRLEAPAKRNIALVDIVEDTPTGVTWHTKAETDRLLALMSPINLAKVDAARSLGARAAGAVFRRMRPGEDGADVSGQRVQRAEIRFDIAGCLRVPTGGSSRQTVMIVEGDTVRSRLMSPRECARLMGLPDTYKLPADLNEALGLMGDGVVVPVVRHLAAHIFEPLLAASGQMAAE